MASNFSNGLVRFFLLINGLVWFGFKAKKPNQTGPIATCPCTEDVGFLKVLSLVSCMQCAFMEFILKVVMGISTLVCISWVDQMTYTPLSERSRGQFSIHSLALALALQWNPPNTPHFSRKFKENSRCTPFSLKKPVTSSFSFVFPLSLSLS